MGDPFHSHLASPMHDLCAELLTKIIKGKKGLTFVISFTQYNWQDF